MSLIENHPQFELVCDQHEQECSMRGGVFNQSIVRCAMSRTTDYILDLNEQKADLWQRSCGYVRPTPPVQHETQPLDYVVDDKTDDFPF